MVNKITSVLNALVLSLKKENILVTILFHDQSDMLNSRNSNSNSNSYFYYFFALPTNSIFNYRQFTDQLPIILLTSCFSRNEIFVLPASFRKSGGCHPSPSSHIYTQTYAMPWSKFYAYLEGLIRMYT